MIASYTIFLLNVCAWCSVCGEVCGHNLMGRDPDVFKTDRFHVEEYSVNCFKWTGNFPGSLI
jgi:hypothetical protein